MPAFSPVFGVEEKGEREGGRDEREKGVGEREKGVGKRERGRETERSKDIVAHC